MNVGKISPVILGSYKISKAEKAQNTVSNSISSSANLMSANTANALRAQVSFNGTKGIKVGVVEGQPAISATLNGEGRVSSNMRFKEGDFEINSVRVKNAREISISKKGNEIIKGRISDELSNDTKITFNVAKHNPEIKVEKDGSTIQLFEGSYIKEEKGKFEFTFPGNYSHYDFANKKPKTDKISFTGTYSSLLCKKDSTVKAVNNEKNLPYAISGQYWQEMAEDDPSIVGLMGGFGTRFANMTDDKSNKPSFVMPNGQSLAGAAFDLAKNAQGLKHLTNITYLNQVSEENPSVTTDLIQSDDDIVNMSAFTSDGGAVINSVINGHIPSDKPLVILNADTITNMDISQAYHKLKTLKNAALVIPSYPVSETRAKSFGLMSAGSIADKEGSKELISFVEKPSNPKIMAAGAMIEGVTVNGEQAYSGNPGIYLFSDVVLKNLDQILPVAEDIALEKLQDKVREKNKEKIKNNEQPDPIPTELKNPFSDSTFLGNAFVPAIVKLCQEGKLLDKNNNEMNAYVVSMNSYSGQDAVWDDVGSAEAFVKNCQDIAYETEANGTNGQNKYYGIRGLEDFRASAIIEDGVIFASPQDKENFENKVAHEFKIKGNAYITCK